MAITHIQTEFAGQVGVNPRLPRIVCTDDYAAITTLNYLQGVVDQGYTFYPTDFVAINYSDGFGWFKPVITASGITLIPEPTDGNVTLPVVSGNLPKFSGTAGLLVDSGISPSNAAKTKMVMANAATVVNNLVKATDTAGTIGDVGARILCGITPSYGGGDTSNTFTVAGLTSGAHGSATIRTSANSVAVAKAVPGTDSLAITFTADPGAGTTVDYIYTTAALT